MKQRQKDTRHAPIQWAVVAIILLLIAVSTVSATVEPLSQNRHIFFTVANDAGVKYDFDGSAYGTEGNNNTYYIKADGGGLNELHITADPAAPYGQVTTSENQSGTFYVSNTGGRGFDDTIIILLAVNGTVPDDFAVHIKTSGYNWTPSSVNGQAPTDYTYVEGAVDETFTKEDFTYGPQTWKPGPGAIGAVGLPLYEYQDVGDTSNTFSLMFIDLYAGNMKTSNFPDLTDEGLGAAKVEYSFENLETFATFNAYGWCLAANQAQGISWTNRVNAAGETTIGTSSYAVIGVPSALTADFTATPLSGDAPLNIQFTDASSGSPTSWAWDFENDGIVDSTEQSPSHTYTAAGTYTVNLTVANEAGSNITVKTDCITVTSGGSGGDTPVANFSAAPTSGDAPLNVQFTDLSTGSPTSWSWDFGDGTSSIEQNPSHIYTSAGNYTVNLTTSNADGSSSSVKEDYITVTPHIARTWTVGATGCDFTTVTDAINSASVVDGDTISVYNGTYAITGLAKSVILTGEGHDLVTFDLNNGGVTITGTGTIIEGFRFTNGVLRFPSTSGGATDMIVRDCIFESMKNPGTASGSVVLYGTNNTLRGNEFRNNTVYNLVYVAGTAQLIENNTFTNTTHSATLKGVIRLALGSGHVIRDNTFTDNQMPCLLLQRAAATVYLNNFNVPDGIAPVQVQGSSAPSAFPWNTPIEYSYTYQGNAYTKVLGNYWNTYTGTDADGDGIGDTPYSLVTNQVDSAPLMAPVEYYIGATMAAPTADFTATPTSGDVPLAVTFTDLSTVSPTSWAWDFENDGVVDSTEQNPTHTYTTAGTYTVNLTVSNAAGSDAEVKTDYITVTGGGSGGEAPVANFTADVTSGKAPLTVNFTDLSTGYPTSWLWDFGDGTNATEQNPQHVYTVVGTYNVSLTATNADGSTTATKNGYIDVRDTEAVPLSNYRFINVYVANDDGVKYDVPDGAAASGGTYTYVNNTYWVMFRQAGGGLNPIHLSASDNSFTAQDITSTTNQSGSFWVTFSGGQPSMPDAILLLAVNGTIPDDFKVHIRSSGNDFDVGTPGTGNQGLPAESTHLDGAVNETFDKDDFIYGPQSWRPCSSEGYPIFSGEDQTDPANQYQLMFIDLKVGALQNSSLPDNGMIKVEYAFTNLSSTAVFNVYGWYMQCNHGTGIIMTNNVDNSGYTVVGASGSSGPEAPAADFTAAPTSGDAPLAVNFTDLSTGSPTAWAWDFENDGVVDSTEQSPSHTYTTAGTYSVNLTVANEAGSNTTVKTDCITVTEPTGPSVLPGYNYIFVNVANDLGVKYNAFDNNTYNIRFEGINRGLNALHISTDPAVNFGQVTVSENQSGTFYATDSGGKGYEDEIILMVAVNGTIPDDFRLRITADGYTWTPNPASNQAPSLDNVTYQAGSLDEVFTKEDFIYGPQIWKPTGNEADYPIYAGQNMTDTENTFQIMFIDLNAGVLRPNEALENRGAVRINYAFENLESFAAFSVYGYCKISNNGDDMVAWTNALTSDKAMSGYSVAGVPYTPPYAPIADFTANATSGDAPLAVAFTDASTGTPASWAWDFENDGIVDSTEQNPVHVYDTVGTYTVNLTVANDAGSNTTVKTDYISVSSGGSGGDAPVANFTANVTSGEAPLAVAFTDASTGTPTSWTWDFENDGVVDSTEQNPVHVYATAGTYTVNLTVVNAGGSDSAVKTGYIVVTEPYTPQPASIVVTPPTAELLVGATQAFAAAVYDTDGGVIDDVTVTWTSSNETVGTVDAEIGLFTARKVGTSTVTAACGNVTGTAVVTVTPPKGDRKQDASLDIPGCNVTPTGNGTTEVTINTTATNATVSGNTIRIVEGNFTLTIETEGAPTNESGTLNGTIANITLDTQPVVTELDSVGTVSASVSANLTGLPAGAGLTTTVSQNVSADAQSAFQLAASADGLTLGDVAYTMNIVKTNLTNGQDIAGATIRMTVSPAWVAAHGGADAIRIIRSAEDGTREVLTTTLVGTDADGMMVFEAYSPNGLSIFGLAAATAASQP
ncbi:MAG TPA: PKD domain-containing protein, partial [Methanoculleus sp.]|nr:PKD domain-containing protein [Methanoculleus sp.]